MPLKIATWNVNSLRARLSAVSEWLAREAPQVLCVQETKVRDEEFPVQAFQDLGYQVAFAGEPAYNGVAIIARGDLEAIEVGLPGFDDPQKRLIAVTYAGLRIMSCYVPNGTAVDSPRYGYKLQWLAALRAHLERELTRYPRLIAAGDFNIAPTDRDVHDPQAWEGQVLVSERERAAFRGLLEAGFYDAFARCGQDACGFSWWDYRGLAFRRNHGLRIDHLLISHALGDDCRACHVDRTPRAQTRPSDHAPVWLELDDRSTGA
ncbi:MAG: exodeoxyribonuclease III [Gammaproteobacteria bacterium]|nr:exodeoxyribonuclease III [Gammaproteobacteria bacterium]